MSTTSGLVTPWDQVFGQLERQPIPRPPIKFIGVWDTVGALGAPGLLGQIIGHKRYQYHDVALNNRILNAYHALAIDEHRRPFAPNVWERPEYSAAFHAFDLPHERRFYCLASAQWHFARACEAEECGAT